MVLLSLTLPWSNVSWPTFPFAVRHHSCNLTPRFWSSKHLSRHHLRRIGFNFRLLWLISFKPKNSRPSSVPKLSPLPDSKIDEKLLASRMSYHCYPCDSHVRCLVTLDYSSVMCHDSHLSVTSNVFFLNWLWVLKLTWTKGKGISPKSKTSRTVSRI